MPHTIRSRERAHTSRHCLLAALLVLPLSAADSAEFEFEPYVAAQLERESNVFRFSEELAEATDTPDTADTIEQYTAGLDLAYGSDWQRIAGTVEARRYRYANFENLDHSEHSAEVGYRGRFLDNTTGIVTMANERRAAKMGDRRTTDLVIERDRTLKTAVNVSVTPMWHVLGGVRFRGLNSPLPEAVALPESGLPARPASPDFRLEETSFTTGLQYGIQSEDLPETESPLLFGLLFEHQEVRFENLNAPPQEEEQGFLGNLLTPRQESEPASVGYRLLILEATARYAVSGLSTLEASLGGTQFKAMEDSEAQSPTFTGELLYRRELSGVTELSAGLFRRFSPFVESAEATTDTGLLLGARWEPIIDLMFTLDYTYTHSSFGGQSPIAPENSERTDDTHGAVMSVRYPFFNRIGVRVFGSINERSSTQSFNDFSDNRFGVEVSYRWE